MKIDLKKYSNYFIIIVCLFLYFPISKLFSQKSKFEDAQTLISRIKSEKKSFKALEEYSFSNIDKVVSSIELYHPFSEFREILIFPLEKLKEIERKKCKLDEFYQQKMSPRIEKFIYWKKSYCEKDKKIFEKYITKRPFMSPYGISYLNLFKENFDIENIDENLLHVSERNSINLFDSNYLGLPEDEKINFLEGQFITFSKNHLLINWGWNKKKKKQVISLYQKEKFLQSLNKRFELKMSLVENGESCQFYFENICFEKVINVMDRSKNILSNQNISIFVTIVLGLFILLISNYLKELGKKRNLEKTHAFIFRLVAHEVRTPLTSLSLSINSLKKEYDNLSRAGQESLMALIQSSYDLNKVVDNSLNELNEVGEIPRIEIIKLTKKIIDKEYAEFVEVRTNLNTALIKVGEFWYKVFLVNLIKNALKHGKGKVIVNILTKGDYVKIQVIDEGKISVKKLRNMLKPLNKGNDSDGLGIGLSLLSYKIKSIGGKLNVFEKPTCFEMEFEKESE